MSATIFPPRKNPFPTSTSGGHEAFAYAAFMDAGIQAAAEAAKAITEIHETELTKRKAIEAAHQQRMAEIAGQIQQMEQAIKNDNRRREDFIEKSFDAITMLIEQGKHEAADKFHERVANSFEGNPLSILIDYRNSITNTKFVEISFKK